VRLVKIRLHTKHVGEARSGVRVAGMPTAFQRTGTTTQYDTPTLTSAETNVSVWVIMLHTN